MASTNDSKADAEFRARLRRHEERVHPNYALQFDGTELTLQENGSPIMSWLGVSGRPGTHGARISILSRSWSVAAGQLSGEGKRDAAVRGYEFLAAI